MNSSPILMPQLIPLANPSKYKLHFARFNGEIEPLDAYLRSAESWEGWQRYKPGRDDFNLPYIFSLMSFYPEPDTWLFGGIWEVVDRRPDEYDVRLLGEAAAFVGRLKVRYPYRDRATRPFLSKHYDRMVVSEVLPEPYQGRRFPGYENINISFVELEALVRAGRPDWKQPLELAKGIYLITDTATGKRYVGSAYGEPGLWSRWADYSYTGHGGNEELRALVQAGGLDYCRNNFRFALLEHYTATISDTTVIAREGYWKEVLATRGQSGLNRN